jgi:Ca2+/Na+ antiporter
VTIKDGILQYKPVKGQSKLQPAVCSDGGVIKYHLFRTGVGIHDGVKVNARFMMMTTLPFWVMQVPVFYVDYPGSTVPDRVASKLETPCAIVGMFGCFCFFAKYMHDSWQAAQEEGAPVNDKHIKLVAEAILNNNLNIREVMHEFQHDFREEEATLKTGLLSGTTSQKTHNLVRHMCAILEPFFKNYDANGDDKISINEFRFLMRDLRENVSEDKTKAIFDAADMDKSGDINFEEFVACIMAFALDEKVNDDDDLVQQQKGDEDDDEEEEEEGDEIEDLAPDLKPLGPEEQQRVIKQRAAAKMFFGSVLVCLFSDPMVDVLGALGDKAGVPTFYVSFLFAPLASNASELVAAMKLAQKRTQMSMKESLSTLCGAAIMNNTFCLATFFFCFLMEGLVWKFSAETISIVLIQFVIGSIASARQVQTLFEGFVVLCCYPAAMLVVYVLESPLVGMD